MILLINYSFKIDRVQFYYNINYFLLLFKKQIKLFYKVYKKIN